MATAPFVRLGVLLVASLPPFFAPQCVRAQEPTTGPQAPVVEPIITEETLPNEPGEWDLRLTGSRFWQGPARFGSLPRNQLFFGIADRWGGEVEVPIAFAREDGTTHFGIGDVSAALKYLARKPHSRSPGVVFGVEVAFPSGDVEKGLGEGVVETAPFVAIVQASRRITVQGNLGYSVVHKVRETDATNQFFYNGAVAFQLPRIRTFLLGEINGTHAGDRSPMSFSPGLKFHFTPERYVAVALPIGLNSQTPRLGIVLQLQVALHSKEHE